ncbi:MAG TPA: hypothetical protein VMS08_03295 [Candidatus Saccharimonadia bacterium]|nr:hypothetical protein [Candidatus Saccharimonadia bacterium]
MVRHEADELRLEALNIALATGLLDSSEFQELKKWPASAQKQGLVISPSPKDTPESLELTRDKIKALLSEVQMKETIAETCSHEIRKLSND